jgi:SOS response associated peptidase (SRAP)
MDCLPWLELAGRPPPDYISAMCGRIIQSGGPLRYAIVDGLNARDSRVHNYPPRWNAAPSQELLVIRRNHKTGDVSLDALRWGLIPYWCSDPKGGRKPINAKGETVRDLPTFREAYRKRRCIVPVDGFFEWKAIKGQKAKQPYAIAMKDGAPFGIAGIWENWKDPSSGDWIRTLRSSPPLPTNWSPASMIACRSSWRRAITAAGSATSPICASCCVRSPPPRCACGRSRRG